MGCSNQSMVTVKPQFFSRFGEGGQRMIPVAGRVRRGEHIEIFLRYLQHGSDVGEEIAYQSASSARHTAVERDRGQPSPGAAYRARHGAGPVDLRQMHPQFRERHTSSEAYCYQRTVRPGARVTEG